MLRHAYQRSASECTDLVKRLLDARDLRADEEAVLRAALVATHDGLDFADAVNVELGRDVGRSATLAFDRRAARDGAMELLQPREQSGS